MDSILVPVSVPMEVKYPGAWLSWVASTTGALRALGVDADVVDVAGASGYAFHICVSRDLCPSGPTMLRWDQLESGVRFLGRSTLRYYAGECQEGDRNKDRQDAHCWMAFKVARREIEAGRPCVLWGAYVPEFAIVTGVQGEAYLVKSFKELLGEPQEPILYHDVRIPGGSYVLAFPTATDFPQADADRHALHNAVRVFDRRAFGGPHRWGGEAYDVWVEALEGGRAALMGNSYNAQCYAEGRRFAHAFLERVAKRNADIGPALAPAVEAYGEASMAMARVAKLFPFTTAKATAVVEDRAAIGEAVDALNTAKHAEARAITVIEDVVRSGWPEVVSV